MWSVSRGLATYRFGVSCVNMKFYATYRSLQSFYRKHVPEVLNDLFDGWSMLNGAVHPLNTGLQLLFVKLVVKDNDVIARR